jgi:hypothetical protein
MLRARKCIHICLVLSMLLTWSLVAHAAKSTEEQAPGRTMAQQATKNKELWITADHTKHELLQQTFASGPEVIRACLSCHSEAAKQFHKTIPWTWIDPNSRIAPFKVHRGKQPYDKVNKTLLIPHLFGKKGSGAYWADWDWKKALESGSSKAGAKFSGEFDFVETAYGFPITHMVAPKEKSLGCNECHSSTDSRLTNLKGFYMPGRDAFKVIDFAGWGVVLACLAGVLIHDPGRISTKGNGRKEN